MKVKKHLVFCVASLFLGGGSLLGAPVISSFSPMFGSSTDPGFVIINGSGFHPGALIVRFNGVTDTTAGATSANTIQARVPAGAPLGSGPIFISVAGVGTFSAQDFTVIGPGPYISDFTPNIGGGGTPVTIHGAHFTGATGVRFNGRSGVNGFVVSDNQIQVTAPANVTTGPISVERAGVGTNISAALFYVSPAISGFSPAFGRQGTNVLITGTNLVGTTAVRFGGLDASSFQVLSNGALQATVPVGATNGLLRIIAPAGSAFSGSNFLVAPTLNNFTPPAGPVGTSVTIFGANFNAGTPAVRFNGVQAANPTGVTFGQLTAVVPAGATTGPITITTTNGEATSPTNFFLPPAITSFTPSNGPPGSLVVVTGVNFTAASAVTFDGEPAAAFYVTNNRTLGAVIPFDVTTGPISVTTPGGVANSTARFYGVPVINVFAPTRGLPGTNVVLTGENFLDATAVRFGGSNSVFNVVNNTTINATVPANAQTGPITVIAPGGTNTTAQSFVLDYTANLSVVVNDSPDPVVVGSNVVYTIIIVNPGPFPAPGVTLTSTLTGPGLLAAATTSQGTLNTNSSPITGAIGQLGVGHQAIVTLTVTAQSPGMITNIATVASQHPDPLPGNNSFTNTTYVQPLPVLNVRRVGTNQIRISWPAALTNYGLEFKPRLEPTPPWSSLTNPPNIVGSEYQLTETNSEPMRYYRLRRLP